MNWTPATEDSVAVTSPTIPDDDSAIANPQTRFSRKRVAITIITITVVASLIGYLFYRYSEEQKARRVVEAHLDAIRSGIGNPYETVDISQVQEVFINVLDYKYLTTLKKEKVNDDPMVFDHKNYDTVFNKVYASYDEFLNEELRVYGNRATRDGDRVVVKSDSSHYEFTFLYDVVITNKLGQQLYKKYEFDLKPSSLRKSEYEITAFRQH